MAKPVISVVGSRENYQSGIRPVLSKIIWSGTAFTASVAERLQDMAMPIANADNAPRVFSFLNRAAAGAQFRVALTDYARGDAGCAGNSRYWFYDATGIGWNPKSRCDTVPNGLPFNPYAFASIEYGGNPFLAAADYDGAGDGGGSLRLIRLTADDDYTVAASLAIPNKTVDGNTYRAHVRDVHVDGGRIFALVVYFTDDGLNYLKSEVREYQLTGFGTITFSLAGTVETGKNAVSLVPYASGNGRYLFIPCIGGAQNCGDNNGADSCLGMIDVTSGISPATVEKKAYTGGNHPAFHDIRGLAIASDGTAYILTGDYDSQDGTPAMNWILFQSTADALVSIANAGNHGAIPPSIRIAGGTHCNAFFWAIGICSNGSDEYLVFGKGSDDDASPVARDELRFLKVGAAWNSTIPGDTFTISADALNGGADAGTGFAINSLDVSAPGTCLKTAHHHVNPAFVRDMEARASSPA